MSKSQKFDKIREWVNNLTSGSFTSYEVEKEFNLHYAQVKPILVGLEELGEVKYLQSTKLWVKTNTEK